MGSEMCIRDRRYANGRGLNKNYRRAERWLRAAAEQGDMRAQYNLGVLFQHGWGVSKDLEKAISYFESASAQGYQRAVKALSVVRKNKEADKEADKEAELTSA